MTQRARRTLADVTLKSIWLNVEKTNGCWLWRGRENGDGYGLMEVDGRGQLVTRLVYALVNGPIPDDVKVLHRCDNPPCCRPDHLFVGTQTDNVRDMIAKGRAGYQVHPEAMARGARNGAHTHPESRPSGERHGNARLTDAQALEIRRLREEQHIIYSKLAAQFGVCETTVRNVCSRKYWRHL